MKDVIIVPTANGYILTQNRMGIDALDTASVFTDIESLAQHLVQWENSIFQRLPEKNNEEE